MKDAILTPSQVLNLLRIDYQNLIEWIERGSLKAVKSSSKHYLFRESDLKAFLETFTFTLPKDLYKQKKRILVVDDRQEILILLDRLVKLMGSGYEVASARDGVQAIQEMGKKRPDLVLLDLVMPKMSGFELCRMIKTTAETAGIFVIAISGASLDEKEMRDVSTYTDAFFQKPIDLVNLDRKIRDLLGTTDT